MSGQRPGELVECILGTVLLPEWSRQSFSTRSEGYAVGTGPNVPSGGSGRDRPRDSVTSVVAGLQRRSRRSATTEIIRRGEPIETKD